MIQCTGYRSEDFEDDDLQAQLYASIYYDSNIESSNIEVPRVTRFNVTDESNEMETQNKPEDIQFTESETSKGKYY
jgi:hypothetical protein